MKINREELYKLYMEKVDKICEIADWKSQFGPREIVDIISDVLEKNEEKLISKS